jgi:hypothetical protein
MKELYQALAASQRSVTALKKSGRGQRSKYLACDDAIAASREAFLGAGLLPIIIDPRLEELATDPDEQTGELRRQLVLCRTLRLVHLATGQTLDIKQRWPVVADRRMSLDHATAAADSFGLTYLMRGLLLFERGDEDDRRTHGNGAEEKPKPAPRPAPRSATKADVIEIAAEAFQATLNKDIKESLAAAKKGAVETLRAGGWAGKVPLEELEAAIDDESIPRQMLRDLYASGKDSLGADKTKELFNSLGVVPGETTAVSGVKAFQIAAAIIGATK